MATRLQLEQQAMTFIQRGAFERAVQCFLEILKQDPRDRRIRQKVGELYLKMNRNAEAMRFLAEAAEQCVREGQDRAAVAIYKRILDLQPHDPEVVGALGECYRRAGLTPEAERLYEQAIQIYASKREFDVAVEHARRLLDLRPKDTSLRFRIAEFLQLGGQREASIKAYQEILAYMKQRGEFSEVARVAEMLLETTPESEDFQMTAAEARLAHGDVERALALAEPLHAKHPNDPRVLEVVAGCHLKAGRGPSARSMFLLLADLYKFTGQTEARATALRNALEASGEDPALKAAVSEADREIARMNMKLSELPVFSPSSDDEVAFCARIDILNSYGFPDRALTAIDEALVTLPHATCLIARGVELLINLKRVDDAVQRLRDAVEWTRGQARQAFADRLAQLGGPKLVFDEVEPGDLLPELEGDALEDMELIDDDELIDDEAEAPAPSRRPATVVPTPTRTTAPSPRPPASLPSSSPPDGVFALGKRLLEEGRLDDAAVAFQDAYREDPTNEEVLLYIGRVRGMQREARAQPRPLVESGPAPRVVEAPSVPPMTTAPPSDPPRRQAASLTVPAADEFDFSRLLSAEAEVGGLGIDDEPRSASADAEHSLVEEALSLESVGAFDEAVAVLEPVNTLPARLIVARCLGSLGRHEDGVSCLRQALELHEGDPAWPDALFELASLQVKAGRIRQALSLLEELRDDFPSYRPSEIATRLRGLARLLSRPT